MFSPAVGLRGDVFPDLSHRRKNGYLSAWHKSGLSVTKVELGVIFNLMRGPFQGCANFHSVAQAVAQFYKSERYDNPIFELCYEIIVKDRAQGRLPPEFGTPEHQEATWQSLADSPLLRGAGTKMKLSRWMSWSQRSRHLQAHMGELYMILLYIIMFEGWFDSLGDLLLSNAGVRPPPVRPGLVGRSVGQPSDAAAAPAAPSSASAGSSASSAAPAAAPTASSGLPAAAVGEPPPARAPVHGDRDGLEAARSNCKSTMHFALRILSKSVGRRIMVAMRMTTEPIEEAHRYVQTIHKTQMGLVSWHTEAADGKYWEYLGNIVEVLNDTTNLYELGFDFEGNTYPEGHPVVDDDQAVALALVDLVRNTLFIELQIMQSYSHRPPLMFALLLSDDPEKVQQGLEGARELWEALLIFEQEGWRDEWFNDRLRGLLWPTNAWVRELLVGLYEAGLKEIPVDLKEELLSMTRGWNSPVPVPCENSFNILRASSSCLRANFLGRASRWHRLIASDILEEHDRKPVKCETSARLDSQKELRAAIFDAKANTDFSLGTDVLKSMGVRDR